MPLWQQFINQGNQLFTHKKWGDALGYYNKAVSLLEDAMKTEITDIQQIIQGWICAYHNIASTYEQQGLIELSRDALMTPFHHMLALSRDPTTTEAIQLAANSALTITLPPLFAFAKKNPNEFAFINQVIEQLNIHQPLNE